MKKMSTPIEYTKYVMDQMGLERIDLEKKGVCSRSHISEYLSGKRKMPLSFIRKFLKITHREKMAYIMIQEY